MNKILKRKIDSEMSNRKSKLEYLVMDTPLFYKMEDRFKENEK